MSEVTAVLVGPAGGAGVDGVEAVSVPSLAEVAGAAAAASTPLVWVLRADATPLDGALDALLARRDGPAASLPVNGGGAPVAALLGRFGDVDLAETIETVATRCVPLAHTPVVSLLAEREHVAATAPADVARFGPYAGTEWTARLFAGRRALLVTGSRVRVDGGAGAGSTPHALRMARAGVWRRGEIVRELRRALVG
jgi:hypothetical protein